MIKIKLEPLTKNDSDDVYKLQQEPGAKEAGLSDDFSHEDIDKFLTEFTKDFWHKKIVSNNNEFMGIVLINSRGLDETLINTKEVGIMIAEKYRGQGVGTVAIKEICEITKKSGVTELWAAAYADNIASQTIFLKNGFEYKYDADMSMFGLPIQKYYLKTFNH